jgi:hypothetical protein
MGENRADWSDCFRRGQDEVVRHIQRKPGAAQMFTALRWRTGPEGYGRVLQLVEGKRSRMIVFAMAELIELYRGDGRRALDKVDRFLGVRE